jgi:hypothetical protein
MSQRSKGDWNAVRRLVDALQPRLAAEADRLRTVLDESNKRLTPFKDPLLVDFGTHRWLKSEREEAYSDWLQWVLQRLKTPSRVFGVLGITSAQKSDRSPVLVREVRVPHGHSDREGRLDLLITCGDEALVYVEVKLGAAEDADTGKQQGYRKYLEQQTRVPVANRHAILLITDAAKPEYAGFTPLRWSDVCVRLRRMVSVMVAENDLIVAGMTLAFVGAVEQNLLRISAALALLAVEHKPALLGPEVANHILRSLEEVT